MRPPLALIVLFFVLSTSEYGSALDHYFLDKEVYLMAVDDYQLPVPIKLQQRVKRQFFYNTDVTGTVSRRRTLYENNGRKVESHSQVSRSWDPRQPTVFGGGFDGSTNRGKYGVNSGYRRDQGATVGTNGRYNLYTSQDEKTTVDAYANYQRNLGTGTSTNQGMGLDIQHRI